MALQKLKDSNFNEGSSLLFIYGFCQGGQTVNTNDQREAFLEDIYQQYSTKLEKLCLQYVSYREEYRGIVDESVQEAFLQAVKDYDKLCGFSRPRIEGWLTITCMNRLTTALRTDRRRKKRSVYITGETELHISAELIRQAMEEFLERMHDNESTERIIAVLNNRERIILDKHIRQRMSFNEIAAQEHTSASAVKGVLARLRKKARKIVADNPQDFIIIFVSILHLVRFIG